MQLNFQTYGSGFPVLILHGLFGSLDNWQPVSRKLGEYFQVFALDLRNHGRSPHSEDFTYELMAEDVHEFMAQHNLSRAHLLGHSMGGKAAMLFALLHPELVEKLVIVDMAPKAYPPVHLPLFEAMLSLDLSSFRERGEIDAALKPSIPEVAIRQFLLKNIGRDDSGAFRWKLNLPAIHRNYHHLKGEIADNRSFDGPTLFIKGERSNHIADGDEILIKRLFKNARIETIPDAGHWVHADNPASFIETTIKFMR
jgi:esterase